MYGFDNGMGFNHREYLSDFVFFAVDMNKPHIDSLVFDSNETPGDRVLRSEVDHAITMIKYRLEKYRHTNHHTKPVIMYTLKRDAHARITQAHRPARVTDRPSHYDIARLAPPHRRRVLIALQQQDAETLAAGGTPETKRMAEQTIMLMLKSYAPWTLSTSTTDLLMQRARLLQRVEAAVRNDTGFQPNWTVAHGTNISSPIFEIWHRDNQPNILSLVQTLSIVLPHPRAPVKTISRLVLSFNHSIHGGATSKFYRHCVGDTRGRPLINFRLQAELVQSIRQSVEQTPSNKPFFATLAFELMESGEHERPIFRASVHRAI